VQKIEYFEEPFPHYVIDEFLTPRAARDILEECIDLEPFYEQAKILGDADIVPDNCDTCKTKEKSYRSLTRDNQTISLDKLFFNKRIKSPTLSFLEHAITDPNFIELMDKSKSIFPITNRLFTSESMLSRYGKCDFYGWHRDSALDSLVRQRIVTCSYYINKEPLNFDGGRLLLRYNDKVKIKKVEPKHNRMVIFPSDKVHAVEYVNLTGKDWDEGRFSVQHWLGVEGPHRFR